jgi:hypothetical protein
MLKFITSGACLMCIAALFGARTASARAAGTSTPVIRAVTVMRSADSGLSSASLLPAMSSSSMILWGQDGNDNGGGKGHDWDKDHDKGHDWGKGKDGDPDGPPSPTPEPSTILTFGAALAIGGGVFYLERLRKLRK